MRNLKLALRTLFKTPFVTIVAALSLALGIGSNTAIFSLFDEMLRRPLPVHQPARLVNITAPGIARQSGGVGDSIRVHRDGVMTDLYVTILDEQTVRLEI